MALASHRRNRLWRRRHASRLHPLHRLNLRRRLVQAGRRPPLRRHHRKQERLGLRLLQIHHPLGGKIRIYPAHHDKRISGSVVVSVWCLVLLQGQDVQKMVRFTSLTPTVLYSQFLFANLPENHQVS